MDSISASKTYGFHLFTKIGLIFQEYFSEKNAPVVMYKELKMKTMYIEDDSTQVFVSTSHNKYRKMKLVLWCFNVFYN